MSTFTSALTPRLHSVASGDLVLSVMPPFFHATWLGAGLVRIAHVLGQHALVPRVVRPREDVRHVPLELTHAALAALSLAEPIGARTEATERLAETHGEFFDDLLQQLLAGPERVFAFSVWRTNVDVTLEVCRRLKAARPDAFIVLGGPEAIECGESLRVPFVDVVVSGAGDTVIVPLVTALLDGAPGRARALPSVWVSERHPAATGPLAPTTPASEWAPVDFSSLVPLVLADAQPRLPVVLNVGCVYQCGFCTNRLIYPEIGWGSVEVAAGEVRGAVELWAAAFPDPATRPGLEIEFCDATVNGNPAQFEALCDALSQLSLPFRPQISSSVLIDRRFGQARLEKAIEAGFTDMFFGLETAADRVRKAMKKPDTAASVLDVLETADRISEGRLHVGLGVIVGWPGETEEEHFATVDFLERYATLDALTPNANVSPLHRTPNAHDRELMGALGGDARGVLWRHDGPAGSPAARIRRLMGIVERFHGLMRVDCPVPVDLLVRWMLTDADPQFIDRWLERHGQRAAAADARPLPTRAAEEPSDDAPPRGSAQTRDAAQAVEASEPEQLPEEPVPEADAGELRRLFAPEPSSGYTFDVEVSGDAALLAFHDADGAGFELYVSPRDESRRCYAHTRGWNISLRGDGHSREVFRFVNGIIAAARANE